LLEVLVRGKLTHTAVRDGMSVLCGHFATATIRYFDCAAIDDAREWVSFA